MLCINDSHTVLINNYWCFLDLHSRNCLLLNVKELSFLPSSGFYFRVNSTTQQFKKKCTEIHSYIILQLRRSKYFRRIIKIMTFSIRIWLLDHSQDLFTSCLQNIVCIYKYRHSSSTQQLVQVVSLGLTFLSKGRSQRFEMRVFMVILSPLILSCKWFFLFFLYLLQHTAFCRGLGLLLPYTPGMCLAWCVFPRLVF